jgi:hypothetical protein
MSAKLCLTVGSDIFPILFLVLITADFDDIGFAVLNCCLKLPFSCDLLEILSALELLFYRKTTAFYLD